MTREEAIYELKNAAWLGTDHSRARTEEAVNMAIKALSQEPISIIREAIEDYVCNYLTDTAKAQEILNALQDMEQEPCEKSMNKAYTFGKNKGVKAYYNEQLCTVELPEAVFRYILSLVPTEETEQEPCTDAVSREDAIIQISWDFPNLELPKIKESLDKLHSVNPQETVTEFADRCRECGARYGKLLEQKSEHFIDGVHAMGYREGYKDAQKQKSGKWEDLHRCWVCSECGQQTHIEHKYCPNCGAKMESEVQTDAT